VSVSVERLSELGKAVDALLATAEQERETNLDGTWLEA
jgi:hypothetical protein